MTNQHDPTYDRDAQERAQALHDEILTKMRYFNERYDAKAPEQELMVLMQEINGLQALERKRGDDVLLA